MLLLSCENEIHCAVDMFTYLSGGLHQCCVGGAKKTIPSWNHAMGNLRRAINMDILNCHLPKSPIVSCKMSAGLLEKAIPKTVLSVRNVH